ncbi:ABC transporter substrate-binding protein [Actinotalea sp. M2MS4P-6]|uniref:ABC transporter substrate-binding protein n=1 Tax=Actinotalea sp. M2MS4P-6 TaxID=2983762 RepID=UPI0021E4614D|nr:ABC transporter substrate-binding protein [Actinotalea sp. M2MS4P-6]MCV2393602.1 ABC transporter substrate-binding protein [Actinotalea sp. M2MS4P-6]
MRKHPLLAPLTLAALTLTACAPATASSADSSSSDTSGSSSSAAADATSCGTTVDEIAAAAAAEGTVNLIALPDTWANYQGILASFTSTYGIDAPVANPDASSADEVTAIQTLRGQPDMPDAVDVGPSFTQQLIDEGYADVYEPTVWDEIPDALKDPEGHWVAAYYGVMSIATNTTLVPDAPTSWADLEDPKYQGMVTLNGDPREAGAAFAAVMAASLANGGSFDDIMPGIEYFAGLKESGNLQTIDVNEANLLSGEVPIALDWTYNFPAITQEMSDAGFDMQVTVPSDGVYGGFYAQSVVTESAHPCAARLWLEHIVGDDGALGYLEGGAIPARYATLLEEGKVSADLAKNLPDADTIAQISFPTQEQVDQAKQALADNWGPMVADK